MGSPECIPNQTRLDFSVYNLDPTRSSSAEHWTGRGFLSWLLAEPEQGTTLIRGRLVREYEYSPQAFHQGGLEGLMAASNTEGDGKGWGLEVSVMLKEVNPDGKAEFSGRREFETMLVTGKTVSVSTPGPRVNASTPAPTREHPKPEPGPTTAIPVLVPSRPPSTDPPVVRSITPPPPPARKSPPPSTPSRATLHALLRSDGKMSPELAKSLASNPMLLRLLRAVPPSATHVEKPPAKDQPVPTSITTQKANEGCCNCGTMESELWRTKAMKGGIKKKVCNGESILCPFEAER